MRESCCFDYLTALSIDARAGNRSGCFPLAVARPAARSEETVVALQRSEGADVGEREAEADLVFRPQRAQRGAAIFDAHSTAIPVVVALHSARLDHSAVSVDRCTECGAQALLVGVAVPQQPVVLAEPVDGLRREQLAGSAQECIPT